MYTNNPNMMESFYPNPSISTYNNGDERFFLVLFVVGGLAGIALGYGLANNNQINNQPFYPMVPVPYYSYPMYPTYSSNNYYY